MAALLIPPTRDPSVPAPEPTAEEEEEFCAGVDFKGLKQCNEDLLNMMRSDPNLHPEARQRMQSQEERTREEHRDKRLSNRDRDRLAAEKAARAFREGRNANANARLVRPAAREPEKGRDAWIPAGTRPRCGRTRPSTRRRSGKPRSCGSGRLGRSRKRSR